MVSFLCTQFIEFIRYHSGAVNIQQKEPFSIINAIHTYRTSVECKEELIRSPTQQQGPTSPTV